MTSRSLDDIFKGTLVSTSYTRSIKYNILDSFLLPTVYIAMFYFHHTLSLYCYFHHTLSPFFSVKLNCRYFESYFVFLLSLLYSLTMWCYPLFLWNIHHPHILIQYMYIYTRIYIYIYIYLQHLCEWFFVGYVLVSCHASFSKE